MIGVWVARVSLGIAVGGVVGLMLWYMLILQVWRYPFIRFHGWINSVRFFWSQQISGVWSRCSDTAQILLIMFAAFACVVGSVWCAVTVFIMVR